MFEEVGDFDGSHWITFVSASFAQSDTLTLEEGKVEDYEWVTLKDFFDDIQFFHPTREYMFNVDTALRMVYNKFK